MLNHKIKIFALFMGMSIFFLTACTKKFDELNTNPSLITEDIVKVNNLMTQIMANSVTGGGGSGTGFGGRLAEFINFASTGDAGFPYFARDYADHFDRYFQNYLINVNEVIRLTEGDVKMSNKNAIARIFRVWLWMLLTDRFGDVPFTEAALDIENSILQPKYDTQEFIYKQLFAELKAATSQLTNDPAKESFGQADIIYEGNIDSWVRFANSLRLRMSIRVRYIDQNLAKTNITEIISSPLISIDGQSAKLLSEASATLSRGYYNPVRGAIESGYLNALRSGFTPVELLVTKNDPRLRILYNPSASGAIWRGTPANTAGVQNVRYPSDSLSLIGDFFRNGQFRFNILSAAEVSFLKAEAVLVGLASGDPQQYFREGIETAMKMYSVPQGEIDIFLSGTHATLKGSEEEKLKQIIEQKYLAIMFQADEAWAEYRRTGYPLIWIGDGTTSTNGTIPRRLTYPFNEYLLNEVNVNDAATRFANGDKLTSRIWWDAKAGLPYSHPKQGIFPPETW